MSILFMISRPQENPTAFESAHALHLRNMKVTFLFIQEACYYLVQNKTLESISFADGIFCIEPDPQIKEQIKMVDRVQLTDYNGWVQLIESNEKLVSWS